jgi:hypothetical protein
LQQPIATIPITGLSAGQLIKAIDFRPATGELYGLAISGAGPFTGQLYTIDTTSGAATIVGAAFSTTLVTGSGYGMDFNPAADDIRIVNSGEENIRVNPNTGLLTSADDSLTGVTSAAAAAYANNYPGTPSTTLFAIDFTSDDLVRIGGPNSNPTPEDGIATKVADINVTTSASTSDRLGLDIFTTLEGNTAFYSGVVGGVQRLHTLDLATGAATVLGNIGNGTTPVATSPSSCRASRSPTETLSPTPTRTAIS